MLRSGGLGRGVRTGGILDGYAGEVKGEITECDNGHRYDSLMLAAWGRGYVSRVE